jgi:hypothetical protein
MVLSFRASVVCAVAFVLSALTTALALALLALDPLR